MAAEMAPPARLLRRDELVVARQTLARAFDNDPDRYGHWETPSMQIWISGKGKMRPIPVRVSTRGWPWWCLKRGPALYENWEERGRIETPLGRIGLYEILLP